MPDLYRHEIIRGAAQNASLAYRNPDYIAKMVYPIFPLQVQKSKIWIHNKGDAFRDESKLRAPGSESAVRHRKGAYVNVDSYQYGIKEWITQEDMELAGLALETTPPLDLQQDAVEANADQHDLRQEILVVANIIAQTWADGNSGGEDAAGLWSPPGSTNTFVVDIINGKMTLQINGYDISRLALAIDAKTWESTKHCDDVRDRIKYVSAKSITPAMVAEMLGLLAVHVGGAIQNTAAEAADGTDGTYVQIWGKNTNKGLGFLYPVPRAIGKKMQVPGIQPRVNINGAQRTSEIWLEKKRHTWEVESREDIGVSLTDTKAGYLWNDTYVT
jgi:hypothetical protein